MSLHIAAQHLASKGRGPDTTLVHMSRGEVKSLSDIAKAHGGSLTVNPDTGLPEAGFLSSILPMVAGAALAATGVGAPMAALLVGGGYGAATGSLKKGLMAGLGAYGGAGLGAGLAEAGMAEAALPGAAPTFTPEVAPTSFPTDASAYEALKPTASQFGAFGEAPAVAPDARALGEITPSMQQYVPPAPAPVTTTAMPSGPGFGTESSRLAAEEAFQNMSPAEKLSQAGRGLSGIMDNQATRDAFMNKVGGASGLMKYGMAGLAPMLMQGPQNAGYKGSGPNPFRYRYEQTMPEAPNPTGSAETMQYRGTYVPYAQGGLSHLGDYSDGGRMLRGPGDGVSDSIPATIGGKRPARLADGEFVVPARIVSELGNGSSEAGARKLYAMMDRVQNMRKKSIGKNRVAVNSRADKALPA